MKMRFSLAIVAALLTLAGCDSKDAPKLETDTDKAAYSAGYLYGKRMHTEIGELSNDNYLAGIRDAFAEADPAVPEADMMGILQTWQKSFIERKQQEEEAKAGAAQEKAATWLQENGKKAGVTTTESGLQYEALSMGNGKKPKATDTVEVHYHGTLVDGTVFDSSVERGEPVQFPLNRVIPGWTEGLQLMPEGSKFRLFVPPELGYGPYGTPDGSIGPNEVLIFEVELLKVGAEG